MEILFLVHKYSYSVVVKIITFEFLIPLQHSGSSEDIYNMLAPKKYAVKLDFCLITFCVAALLPSSNVALCSQRPQLNCKVLNLLFERRCTMPELCRACISILQTDI